MRLALLAMAATVLLLAGGGCQRHNLVRHGCQDGCPPCPNSCGSGCCLHGTQDYIPRLPLNEGPAVSGPPTATYAYPYYTTRGPRDFLLDNPPTIGR
jgi:hypothetical protein